MAELLHLLKLWNEKFLVIFERLLFILYTWILSSWYIDWQIPNFRDYKYNNWSRLYSNQIFILVTCIIIHVRKEKILLNYSKNSFIRLIMMLKEITNLIHFYSIYSDKMHSSTLR